ncbi:helix-hairpin-helix domain-containing protein [Domibacillus sp.]|uniref:helix-hairpin-helix domain-containing protein n=1 Tax=Domibacillus sp. TaxID=1969783 RepID=UPI00281231B4|nr:helix-hairpin-helix domain-containing protein [Domibacillus sp.]
MNKQEVLKKYKVPAAAGAVLAAVWLYGLTKEEPQALPPEPALLEAPKNEPAAKEADPAQDQPSEVAIDVKGAVSMPGIYVLSNDQRVNDAINKAGGLTEKADAAAINLAQRVQDEMVIYVPAEGEGMPDAQQASASSSAAAGSDEAAESAVINVNTADSALLQELPGVGESKAQAIIDFRETEGAFTAVEDLKNVAGIGDKIFEKLAPLVTIQ